MAAYNPNRAVTVADGAMTGASQSTDETVAGERRRPVLVGDDVGQDGVLEGQEDAHVAARWIEGSDEGDHKQGPERLDPGKSQPSRGHQEACGQQGTTPQDPVGDQPEGERQQGRAQQ